MPEQPDLTQGFKLGEWTVLPARGLLIRGAAEVRPEPLVFGLLLELAKRDGDLVTKEDLIDALWDGRPIGDTPITRAVYELRKHLDDRDRPNRYVETLSRRGYRLLERVEPLDQPTAQEERAEEPPTSRSSPLRRGLTVLLILAVTATIVWWNDHAPEPECMTIAVEPFVNRGVNPDDAYLSYGFREELAKTLYAEPGLCVVMADSAAARQTVWLLDDRPAVDAILSGGVQRVGEDIKVGYQLVDADSGSILETDNFTDRLTSLFDLQVRVAESVHARLLPSRDVVLLTSTRPENFTAYQHYLRGLYAFERRGYDGNFELAVQSFEQTLDEDPAFGPAYLQLATAVALAPVYAGEDASASYERALDLVRAGVNADASIEAAAAAVHGYVRHQQKDWSAAERDYKRATAAQVVDVNAFSWYSRMLASVGRLDAALEQALEAWQMDPDNAVINSRVALSYSWMGDTEQALKYFDRAEQLGARGATHMLGHALLLTSMGDIDAARTVAKSAVPQSNADDSWVDAVLNGIQYPAQRAAALAAVDGASTGGQLTPQVEVVARMVLGDTDGAMRIAGRLREPGEAFEMDLLWIPAFEPLRRHPAFPQLVADLGLTQYWESIGCEFVDARVRCQPR